jgi:hypothetical protein
MTAARRLLAGLVPAALITLGLGAASSLATASPSVAGHVTTKVTRLELPKAFTPVAPKGGHDLYHCSLLDPKVTTDQMITQVTFTPGTAWEDHHAILYWVPPSEAAAARTMNKNGQGWTCFGGPGIGGTGSVADLGATAWLGAWGPGHGTTVEPAGTGMPLPAGSLIVMQIHYNLLAGHAPDRSKVTLDTVPAATSGLIPLHIDLYPAPIDVPCPSNVQGQLCDRAASLRDIGRRFGQSAVNFDNLLEAVCSNGTPVASDTASCTWPIGSSAYVWDVTAHMHLLGVSFTVTLNPGTPQARVLLNVPSYDFHYQRSYDLANPVLVGPGDHIQVSCTFNPELRSELPYLSSLPPRYVLWADGSSDEMCLAILGVTTMLPAGVSPSTVSAAVPTAPSWPAALARAAAVAPAAFLGGEGFLPAGSRGASRSQLRDIAQRFPFCG